MHFPLYTAYNGLECVDLNGIYVRKSRCKKLQEKKPDYGKVRIFLSPGKKCHWK